jgi:hypothetical protein
MIERAKAQLRRLRHVWTWRLRYWWLDTESGRQAHIAVAGIAAVVVVLDLIKMAVVALAPRPAGQPAKAIIWWVVYIIVALIAAAMYVAMKQKGFDWKDFVRNGIAAERLEATGDGFALALVDWARKCETQGAARG